ncbi:MAG TPA: ABC transporter substrate-binding protein, partial [Chloroflexota bacterium]|nr:ABC transporter substrate-binding protein [Chloroflexota bacterium]
LCLRDMQNQIINANVGGVPPTLVSLYSNPVIFKDYPFHADILSALEHASVRPKTPVYQVVSIDISHLVSPPGGISPKGTEKSMISMLNNALQSKGLVP